LVKKKSQKQKTPPCGDSRGWGVADRGIFTLKSRRSKFRQRKGQPVTKNGFPGMVGVSSLERGCTTVKEGKGGTSRWPVGACVTGWNSGRRKNQGTKKSAMDPAGGKVDKENKKKGKKKRRLFSKRKP